jgi:hypothetical protein
VLVNLFLQHIILEGLHSKSKIGRQVAMVVKVVAVVDVGDVHWDATAVEVVDMAWVTC